MQRMVPLLLLASCAWSIKIPNGFAKLEDNHRFEFYAASPDGCYVAISEFEGAEGADLKFWVQCVTRQLTQIRGYKLLQTKDFSTNDGREGKTLLFLATINSARFLYCITLVMDGEDVICLEATGPEDAMKRRLDDILAAFRTLS